MIWFFKQEHFNFDPKSPMAFALSAALFEATEIMREKHPERLAGIREQLFEQINFTALSSQHEKWELREKAVECSTKYYQHMHKAGENCQPLEQDLLALLAHYEDCSKTKIVRHNITGKEVTANQTALMAASYYECLSAIELLFENDRAHLDKQQCDGWTALMMASCYGYADIVRYLLAKGADPDKSDNADWTALMFASRYEHVDIVTVLLVKGADPDKSNNDGKTALMLAISNSHEEVIRVLTENDALLIKGLCYRWEDVMTSDVACADGGNMSSYNSFAPIHDGFQYSWQNLPSEDIPSFKQAKIFFAYETHFQKPSVQIMRLPWYQEAVSLIRIRDIEDSSNPLVIYCIQYKGYYFRLGGTSSLMHYLSKTAAIKLEQHNALNYLRFFCFFIRGELESWNIVDPETSHWQDNILSADDETFSNIQPPQITHIDEKGNYHCEATVAYGFILFQAKFIINTDGLVNMIDDKIINEAIALSQDEALVLDNKIHTPLIAAVQEGFKNIVQLLLQRHVDPNVTDHEGNTALSYAKEEGDTEIIEMLLAAGATDSIYIEEEDTQKQDVLLAEDITS